MATFYGQPGREGKSTKEGSTNVQGPRKSRVDDGYQAAILFNPSGLRYGALQHIVELVQ